MNYEGKDSNNKECLRFLLEECEIRREETRYAIEIEIKKKDRRERVALIVCFFYNYRRMENNKDNSMHIKSLGVTDKFTKMGIATYLMKEVITYAEQKRIKNITVNPSASTYIISQEDLEEFYKKFDFSTFFNRRKKIEFKDVTD